MHFLKTDAHLNKQPQQVPFSFSWWQTIFWLNCTGNKLRNLKEHPRWFLALALRYGKSNTAEQTFLWLCSPFDLWLMDFRDPLALLIGLKSCLINIPSTEFSTHPLKLFPLVSERFLEFIPHIAEFWQMSLTSEHRRASANMDNSQTLQIQLHLSKGRKNML